MSTPETRRPLRRNIVSAIVEDLHAQGIFGQQAKSKIVLEVPLPEVLEQQETVTLLQTR